MMYLSKGVRVPSTTLVFSVCPTAAPPSPWVCKCPLSGVMLAIAPALFP